ncbi:hypothetical protein OSC52_03700 [Clostridium pasteurianum]|uniref:CorA family divalent cation transporter n=1 Tax=Clostridium pasteurianum TaxID=1501 RepID=UPI002260B1D0|nr:CorA family divalent cation transporter [Clostridium pasteurianum]UZW14959.1 hypothetical protein OSC52_03700 [Clostridium pasteurianum]
MSKEAEKKKLYSYHIFMFPFKWDFNKDVEIEKGKIAVDKFVNNLLQENWEDDVKKFEITKDGQENSIDNEEAYNNYTQYVYFYDNARNAIFNVDNEENNIVYNKKYKDTEDMKYIIKISGNNEKEEELKEYNLDVDKILLKVYETGVGILSFHLANYDEKQKDEDDILKINEYGRRIYPQFLSLEKVRKTFLAAELQLLKGNYNLVKENFSEYSEFNGSENKRNLNTTKISKTIMGLLGENFTDSINKEEFDKEKILITTIIDDRMFTIGWYGNPKRIEKLQSTDKVNGIKKDTMYGTEIYYNDEYNYLNDEFWYKYIFIDGSYSTCQNKIMRRELLKKHTYDRWIDYRTLYGITRYSLMLLTDNLNDKNRFLINHMKTMYYEMVSLVLAQRASILKFSDEASESACELDEDKKSDKNKIRNLQKAYIKFINRIYFREVTAQEQGIEMYNKLVECMNIERDIKKLDDEINELHKYADLISTEKTNDMLNIITFLGAAFLIPTLLTGFFGMNILGDSIIDCFKVDNLGMLVFKYLLLPTLIGIILIRGIIRYWKNR